MKCAYGSTVPSAPIPPERPMTWSPALAISSTQISLESTVPWLNGWPRPRVRTTISTRYGLPGFERRDLGPERAEQRRRRSSPPFAEGEEVDADLLVLAGYFAWASAASSSPRIVGQAGVGAGEEVVVDLAAGLAVEVAGAEVGRGDEVHVAVDALRPSPSAGSRSSAPRGPRRPRAGTCRSGSGRGGSPCSGSGRTGCRPCGRSSRTSSP